MTLIRPAELADAAALARCHLAAWRDSYRPRCTDEILSRPTIEDEYTAKWSAKLQRPKEIVLLADGGAEGLVGFIEGGRERAARDDYQGEIYAVYVLPDYRRQGVGRKLFRRFAQALREQNIGSAIVWVFADNPCRHCYAAWGAEPVETKPITVAGQNLTQAAY
ncbi:MAG TPA: GNAT family N-acetyltransferase, partial [Pirellulales bacterium]|nr:GNAT family N-acetyltransferase [Pirellulales bacterium]